MLRRFFNLVVIYLLISGSICLGQSPPPPPPPAKPVKVVGKAKVFYFKEKNRSSVDTDFTLLGGMKNILREDVFQVIAGFTAPGEKITRPQTVNLMLYSYTHGTDYRYNDDHQLELLIDGKLIGSGLATLGPRLCSGVSSRQKPTSTSAPRMAASFCGRRSLRRKEAA